MLLASVGIELFRLAMLQNTLIGVPGGALLNWTGPLAATDGWYGWVGLPLFVGLLLLPASAAVARTAGIPRLGTGLFALGVLAQLGWTGLVGLLGLGNVLDTWLHGPVLFLTYAHIGAWEAWGRWTTDGVVLGMLALLLGFGPGGPSARRAVFVGLLALLADQGVRIAVTVLSGSVPFLFDGLGPLAVGAPVLWTGFAVLAVVFVGLLANIPGADGPPRRGLVVGLGLAGLLLGLEAGGLYGLGLLNALGIEVHVHHPMPLYPFLLGAMRLGFVVVGALAVGLGRWREVDTHTALLEEG